MKIAIVGAGAMGSLFGARLAEAGSDVTLVDVNAAHVDAINRAGLAFQDGGRGRTVSIKATTVPGDVGGVDLIVLFCKHLHTKAAMAGAVPMITPDTYVWTIQNGIGNVEIINEFVPESRIAKGLTSVTAIIDRPGAVTTKFEGESETFIWPVDGKFHPALEGIVAEFTQSGLPTYLSPDIDYRIWRKLAVNCSLTVLSAAANVGIGPIGDSAPGQRLLREIVAEVADVARAKGVPLEFEDAWDYVEQLREKATQHIGSTTVDLQNGRATEIEAMNGAVVREGNRLGVATPTNSVIADFIRLIEATRSVRLTPSI